jgi:hypothetical protein
VLLTRLPLGVAPSFDLHVLGTPPALILSQDQTLHKTLCPVWRPEKLVGAVCGSKLADQADPDRSGSTTLALRRTRPVKCTVTPLDARNGGAGSRSGGLNSLKRIANKKAACAASCLLSGWRPTDLCATALFSFQGTNADVWPYPDRITDRTEGGGRQSHDRYLSTRTRGSQGKLGALGEAGEQALLASSRFGDPPWPPRVAGYLGPLLDSLTIPTEREDLGSRRLTASAFLRKTRRIERRPPGPRLNGPPWKRGGRFGRGSGGRVLGARGFEKVARCYRQPFERPRRLAAPRDAGEPFDAN